MVSILQQPLPRPLVLVLGVSGGCYMAVDDSAAPLTVESDSDGASEGGSSTGEVSGARGILESNSFKLYWEHYDAWEQGACTRLRLKNEGGEVRGWQLDLELSEAISTWIDSGGAFMWLVEDHLTVEQESLSPFATWESVEMYYCAEPAVILEGFTADWQDGDRDGTTDESASGSDEVEMPTVDGVLSYAGEGGTARFAYESYANGGYTCLNFSLENTNAEPRAMRSFDVQLSNGTEFVYEAEGVVVERSSDVLSFIFDNREPVAPGAANDGRVCMVAMAEPVGVLDVFFD